MAKQQYGNESISQLKGADRVRKRPGVIFGSDGLDGCEHSVFEILSNSIDEAREGHSASCTREENTKTPTGETTNIHWDLTAWDPARPNTPPNTWT